MNLKDLYISKNFAQLDFIAQKDDVIKSLKKSHRFSHVANKMMAELLQCQDDQEKCYIFCKRYMKLVDHIFKTSDDKIYSQSLYLSDSRKVKQILNELIASLEQRYKELAKETSGPLGLNTDLSAPVDNLKSGDALVFSDIFIFPSELFDLIQHEKNFLVIDIRAEAQYQSSRISANKGEIVNIPGDEIIPGLSANTLGHRLDSATKDVWERRDSFDVIILMDNNTEKYNYVGTKLEKLRSLIVEWDLLRNYKHEPVILNGGLKEFVDWYPTTVENSQVFLCQTNAEIDELLDLESIIYPESGSTRQMNLKVHGINSIANFETRLKRDFEDDDTHNLQSLSEGNLPLDFYSSKENLAIDDPFKSISEESLSKNLIPPEPDLLYPSTFEGEPILKPKPEEIEKEPLPKPNLEKIEKEPLPKPNLEKIEKEPLPKPNLEKDEAAEIKEILEDDKAALLRQARSAAKPILDASNDQEEKGDRKRDRPNEVDIAPSDKTSKISDKEPSFRGRSSFIKPPAVDRSFKPVTLIGKGYTGLRNVKNICYMNCLLQCLKVIPLLKSIYVTTDRYISCTSRTPPKLNYHFAQVLRELWGGTYHRPKTFLIRDFKERICEFAPMYDRNTHEDCFEFFMFLFNAVSEDCSTDILHLKMMTESERAWYGHLQGRSSVWVDNFYYQIKNTKICCACRKINYAFETDSTLMLPVANRRCYLRDLITDYLRDVKLVDFSCSYCKSTGTIVNKKELAVEPEVLVIVLKRYLANPDGTFRKNDVEVNFPLYDLHFGNSRYKLYGVVQHSGNMAFGHYYASVLLNPKRHSWVQFNDEMISTYQHPINEIHHVKSSAAGFFYVRSRPR